MTAAHELNFSSSKEDQAYARATTANSRRAGMRAWDWYKQLGEVHYAISRSARIAGYAKLMCVRYGDDGSIEDIVTDGPAAEHVQNIYSPFGGTRGLFQRFYTLMKIPGDSYLCEVRDPGDEYSDGYHFLSPDELDLRSFSRWRPGSGKIRWITAPASGDMNVFTREIAPDDLLGRVWVPDNRWVDLTDSALMSLDTECEALFLLTKTIKAKLMSRFAMAGILFIPNGISTARVTRDQEQVAGQDIDNTLNFIIAMMTRNVRNWEDATAWMPMLLKGPADEGEKIRHLIMDRDLLETDLMLRAELIGRIMQGLDSNADTTQGVGDKSHFAAWAASDEERRIAVQPDLESMCFSLTRLILHRKMLEDGTAPEEVAKHGIWYDLSASAVRANQQEDSRQAIDRNGIGMKTFRRTSGFLETDAPDDDESIRWAGRQAKNPYLMLWKTPGAEEIDWDMVERFKGSGGGGPAADSPAEDSEAGPGSDSGSPDSSETDTPRTERPV
jgi:hypothetical protein